MEIKDLNEINGEKHLNLAGACLRISNEPLMCSLLCFSVVRFWVVTSWWGGFF